ncbi:protein translocase subunit SecD [Peptococcus simiae]|uniref:Protein translocase subunit SecD n=1 Tax=Peptococcus simiae TaxID=1643805 RepID=A0ABW9GYV5_9FIRM
MKRRGLAIVAAVVVLLAVAIVVLLPVYKSHANLGLDLQGGVQIRLEAPKGTTDEEMQDAMGVISNRVNGLGVTEPEIRREGTNRIAVELPGIEDTEKAIELIGTTAKLEFVRADTGEVVLNGSQLKNASAITNDKAIQAGDQFGVSLKFKKDGADAFAKATSDLVAKFPTGRDPQRVIRIELDGQPISSPFIQEPITNGEASISGGFESLNDASNLAMLLNAGALPVKLEVVEQNTVGAQLGPDAIQKSIKAAIIGSILLALLILVLYIRPGVIACLSLVLYALLLAGTLILIRSTITLQVIAAFLLSVGMAVDANVLIYERIKEELRQGKTVRVATKAGFEKAFRTVIDSNVTTLIAGVVLIVLGTGEIRGFAITLCIGIVISLFTAITFTRFILNHLISSGVVKGPEFYGVKRIAKEEGR